MLVLVVKTTRMIIISAMHRAIIVIALAWHSSDGKTLPALFMGTCDRWHFHLLILPPWGSILP
jgi:hypothetical protein